MVAGCLERESLWKHLLDALGWILGGNVDSRFEIVISTSDGERGAGALLPALELTIYRCPVAIQQFLDSGDLVVDHTKRILLDVAVYKLDDLERLSRERE